MSDLRNEVSENLGLDLFSIIRDVLHDWWMILTAGMAGVMCAYIVLGAGYHPQYTSSTTLIVSARGATNAAASDLSVTKSMADTLEQVLESKILKKKVQEHLGLSGFPARIDAAVIPETNMMTLRVAADSPELSFRIMKSVLANYTEVTDYAMNSVVISVLDPPVVPYAPSNPMSVRAMLKKIFLYAAAAMTALLSILSYLRDNVKNEKQVEAKLDTKLFATIYHEEKDKTLRSKLFKSKKSILITDPVRSFMFVETYKKIRTKLLYKSEKEGCKIILVTSVMENEGKSSVATNIALALAQKNSKVMLIDGDLRRPALYKVLQKTLTPEQEIGGFLNGKNSLEQVLVNEKNNNLFMIIGSRKYQNSTEMLSRDRMKSLISAIRKKMDYVIIDSPPTALMADAEVLAEYADMSLLVVKQSVARARDINDTIDMLENGGSTLLGCIFNDVRTGIFTGKKVWNYSYGYGGYHRYGHYRKYGYGSYYGKKEKE